MLNKLHKLSRELWNRRVFFQKFTEGRSGESKIDKIMKPNLRTEVLQAGGWSEPERDQRSEVLFAFEVSGRGTLNVDCGEGRSVSYQLTEEPRPVYFRAAQELHWPGEEAERIYIKYLWDEEK